MPNLVESSSLTLSTDEAMGLLEVCLMSEIEFDETQQRALMKLSLYCREAYSKYRQSERNSLLTESNHNLPPILIVA